MMGKEKIYSLWYSQNNQFGRWAEYLLTIISIYAVWAFMPLPATDLPEHLSIAVVLKRLLNKDIPTDIYYFLNIQPIPYYISYIFWVPLLYIFNPWVSSSIFYTLLLLAHRFSFFHLLRVWSLHTRVSENTWRLYASMWVVLFFGPLFFWGFISTQVGIPFVFWAFSYALRYAANPSLNNYIYLVFCSIIAVLSHVILCLPIGLIFWGRWFSLKFVKYRYSFMIFICSFLLWSGLTSVYPHRGWKTDGVGFEKPIDIVYFFLKFWDSLDMSFIYIPHICIIVLGLVGVFIGIYIHKIKNNRTDLCKLHMRFIFLNIMGNFSLFFLFPLFILTKEMHIWGIPFRYLTIAEAALMLFALFYLHPDIIKSLSYFIYGASFLFMLGIVNFFYDFQKNSQPLHDLLKTIPPNKILWANHQYGYVKKAWPPLNLHNPVYYVGLYNGLACNDFFEEKHIPVGVKVRITPDNSEYIVLQNEAVPAFGKTKIPKKGIALVSRNYNFSLWVRYEECLEEEIFLNKNSYKKNFDLMSVNNQLGVL